MFLELAYMNICPDVHVYCYISMKIMFIFMYACSINTHINSLAILYKTCKLECVNPEQLLH